MKGVTPLFLPVDEYTTPCPITVAPDKSLNDVMELMVQYGIRHIPVIEKDRPIGIISDRDLRILRTGKIAENFTAKEIMVTEIFLAMSGCPLDEVVFEMSSKKIGSAIVVNSKMEVLGMFTATDAMNALVEVLRGEVENMEEGYQTLEEEAQP